MTFLEKRGILDFHFL